MDTITPAEARAYLERWRRVTEAEEEELRSVPIETKLRQLTVLIASRSLVGADPDRERRASDVAARWARVRQALRA